MDLEHNPHYIIAALVLSNLGMIGALITVGYKMVWWFSKLESRVDASNALGVRAHKRIDKLDDQVRDLR